MEIWKSVKGYDGILEVSNMGNVRTLDRIVSGLGFRGSKTYKLLKGKHLSQSLKKNGYFQIAIRTPKSRRWFTVHGLVARAFIENPLNLPQINHKDGNKQNNNHWNLEWNTASQNQNHAVRTGLCSTEESHYKAKLTVEDIRKIRKENDLHWKIAEKYGVSRSTITSIKSRKSWKYVDD